MKNKFCFIFLFLLALPFCFFSSGNANAIFAAEDLDVLSDTGSFYVGEISLQLHDNNDNILSNSELEYNNLQLPYQTVFVANTITISQGTTFEYLTLAEREELASLLCYKVKTNNTGEYLEINFDDDNNFTNSNFDCTLIVEEFAATINLSFTAKLPAVYTVLCEYNNNNDNTKVSANTNVVAKYAQEAESVQLTNINTNEKFYDTANNNVDYFYSDILLYSFKTTITNAKYMNPETEVKYDWFTIINNEKTTELGKQETYTISNLVAKVGTYVFGCDLIINGQSGYSGSVELTVTTQDNSTPLVSMIKSGKTEQVLGEETEAVYFLGLNATTATSSIAWWLKDINTTIFKKVATTNSYEFNPSTEIFGEYQIFCVGTVNGKHTQSEIYTVKINPFEPEVEQVFKVIIQLSGSKNNTEVYTLTLVDGELYFQDSEVVWYVNGTKFVAGNSVEIIVPAGNYSVFATVENQNITNPVHLTVKENKNSGKWWIYLSAGSGVLLFCFAVIVISNKSREKIW